MSPSFEDDQVPSPSVRYKIKLKSGRILGPLEVDRIQLLMSKKKIDGSEMVREYPGGEWISIYQVPSLVELLVAQVKNQNVKPSPPTSPPLLPSSVQPNVIEISPRAEPLSPSAPRAQVEKKEARERTKKTEIIRPVYDVDEEIKEQLNQTIYVGTVQVADPEHSSTNVKPSKPRENGDKKKEEQTDLENHLDTTDQTIAFEAHERPMPGVEEDASPIELYRSAPEDHQGEGYEVQPVEDDNQKSLAYEKTVLLPAEIRPSRLAAPKNFIKIFLIAGALGYFGYDTFLNEPKKPEVFKIVIIKPQLPSYVKGNSDPKKSAEIYNAGMKFYLDDTILGYRKAEQKLRLAASYDINNVKALAMLASTYLNLIDVSNKNEEYFAVIQKLIELSRAQNVDLPESVIADVEFYLTAHKAEAAQNRIVEYTKSHQNYGVEMYYYLAEAFFERNDVVSAARYLSQFPDQKAFSAKIFYLRGLIAEKLGDNDAAFQEYQNGIHFNPNHAKSHLRISSLLAAQGKLVEAAKYLDFLMHHPDLLAPKDLGMAYYLHASYSEFTKKWDMAIADMERAVKLDPDNHDFLLELYTLQAKSGESRKTAQKMARMYYFLGEGEKLIGQNRYQDALTPLLQARQANNESYLPLVKIGDMFNYLHDLENAKMNYKLASDRAPENVQVWTKYIESLIESYDWEAAKGAIDKLRKLPASKKPASVESSLDKALADMYQKQQLYVEAQTYYKKAMRHDAIDPSVYVAYGKSLMSIKNFKDAPFFFALALRHDPFNISAIVLSAQCLAETESIDRAIQVLQEEAKQRTGAQAELLSAIAELQGQKGDWDLAQQTIDQAFRIDPDFANSWKIQAQIYMNKEHIDKTALDKALSAYKSYSDRNPSDPSGYLERYKIFLKKTQYEEAKDELARIFVIYPKYPNLHYFLGALYTIQGNHRAAAEEFKTEITNNPNNLQAIVAYGREIEELGDSQTALAQFTKVMQQNPKSSDAKQNAAWSNYHLKNFQAAIALFKEAIQLDSGNPLLHKRLGIVFRDVGDFSSACSSFRKYLEMEPDAPDKEDFRACL